MELEEAKDAETFTPYFKLCQSNLSKTQRDAIDYYPQIPEFLLHNTYRCFAVKEALAHTLQIQKKLDVQFPCTQLNPLSKHFIEITDSPPIDNTDLTNYSPINKKFLNPTLKHLNIGVCNLGRPTPGLNNVVDGLLTFSEKYGFARIYGFIGGAEGLVSGEHFIVDRENFHLFKNQGGGDFLGTSRTSIKSEDQFKEIMKVCKRLRIDGLVLIGSTNVLTHAAYLTEYLLKRKSETKVIAVPSSVDGNIRHRYLETSIGFDTTSKMYGQLCGNTFTDAASSVKYWYLIRMMGRDPSHLVLETALQTYPNSVVIAEESAKEGETLDQIVNRLCDLVIQRHEEGKNFGTIIIPEGLLSNLAHYKVLIQELNEAFNDCENYDQINEKNQKLINDHEYQKQVLSPWSAAVFDLCPEFFKKNLLVERMKKGKILYSQIETEKLIAYFMDQELTRRAK